MQTYLILAHNNFTILEKLIKMLDHSENDIYIHIDKSVKDFDFGYYRRIPQKSRVFFTKRVHISWGDYSMIKAELILLEQALQSDADYKYFHLISGADLPLAAADELVRFFDESYPKQFIHFAAANNNIELSRVRHYHFFTGRRNLFNRLMTKAEQLIQTALKINRTKNLALARGSQWFSITDSFAKYIIKNKAKIEKQFKHTFIPDEFMVQMIAVNTDFKNDLYCKRFDNSNEQNMRYIDWKRGSPYTFTENEFDEIMGSGCLFVRKLTEDNKLPDMIYEEIRR